METDTKEVIVKWRDKKTGQEGQGSLISMDLAEQWVEHMNKRKDGFFYWITKSEE